jgi:hypothetical protein
MIQKAIQKQKTYNWKSNNVLANLPGNVKQNNTKFEANNSRRRGKVIHIKTETSRRKRLCSEWESLNTDSNNNNNNNNNSFYITATQVTTLYANSFPRSTSLASFHRQWHSVTQYHASYTRSIERRGRPTCPRDSVWQCVLIHRHVHYIDHVASLRIFPLEFSSQHRLLWSILLACRCLQAHTRTSPEVRPNGFFPRIFHSVNSIQYILVKQRRR